MAKLKNVVKVWTAPEGEAVTVGNNRTITRDKRCNGYGVLGFAGHRYA